MRGEREEEERREEREEERGEMTEGGEEIPGKT